MDIENELSDRIFEMRMARANAQFGMADVLEGIASQISGYRKNLIETGMHEMAVDQLCLHFGVKMQESMFGSS